MARIRADYVFGVLNGGGIDADDTVISSPQLARLPEVTGGDVAALTIHDSTSGEYEIVHVTGHVAAATTATVARAQEGSAAAIWADGTSWVLGITQEDVAEFTAGDGGTGGGVEQVVNLPLSTLTGWTVGSGSWAIDAGVIRQTNTTVTQRRLFLDALMPLDDVTVEVEVKLNSATSTAAGARGGIVIGGPATGDGSGGDGFYFNTAASTTAPFTVLHSEPDGVSNWADLTLASSIAASTWAKLRVRKTGMMFSVWIDGTFLGSILGTASSGRRARLALYSYAADVSFRNMKVWTPSVPA